MTKIYVWSGRHLLILAMAIMLAAVIWMWNEEQALTVIGETGMVAEQGIHKEFRMVTGEFKAKRQDGTELESYRWDPNNIIVKKGDHVTLRIFGVNGVSHPFEIKAFGVKGEVTKGRETAVSFIADREGTFEMVCLAHPDIAHNGPMIAYIHVLND